jgi:cyclophilin family peptidyl-prolyl cis-trans isomerase
MMYGRYLTLLFVSATLAACAPSDGRDAEGNQPAAGAEMTPTVVLETTMGRIVMELNRERAPESVENFLRYVRGGFYDGLSVHRVQPNVIQTGLYTADRRARSVPNAFPVVNEADNGLQNVRGAVAMARTADPHSATNQFFINVQNNTGYDFTEKTVTGWGYAVFGRVTEGMDVLDAIVAVPTSLQGNFPAPVDPIVIERAYVAEGSGN